MSKTDDEFGTWPIGICGHTPKCSQQIGHMQDTDTSNKIIISSFR